MSRRAFGTIKKRGNRPGYYVAFSHNGRRYERAGGPTKAVARKKLNAVHACLEMGQSIGEVLSSVFGEFHGSRLTFRDAAPLYLDYARTRKKPSTLKNDVHRLRLLCAAPWAGEYLAKVTPEAIAAWVQDRRKKASGATGYETGAPKAPLPSLKSTRKALTKSMASSALTSGSLMAWSRDEKNDTIFSTRSGVFS